MRISLFCTAAWLLCSLCLSQPANALQYKSRLFNDANTDLSESEMQNIAALEEAFANYQDDYQIASTGQFLARQMVANKEYDKAAQYYAKTLQAGSLDELFAVQLRREYAEVLLLLNRYAEVEPVLANSPLQAKDRILLARASLEQQAFLNVIEWLQPLQETLNTQDDNTLRQLAAIYFKAKALALSAESLAILNSRYPQNIDLTRQLTGIYIQLQAFQQALDLWSLSYANGLLVEQQDLVLLADLYQRQGSPEKAARTVQEGFTDSLIAQNAEHYYKLFEFWYQAKEIEPAREALLQSVLKSQSIEHGLILAELLQRAELWQNLLDLINLSCQTILPDRFVGRINLMQGIALHKLGNNDDARRALINASLVSGVKTQAREWLQFIGATPATLEESRRLWGDCLPDDPSIDLPDDVKASDSQITANTDVVDEAAKPDKAGSNKEKPILNIVTLPNTRFYGTRLKTSAATMADDMKKKTFNLIKNLMRSGGRVDGKMHLLMDEAQTADNIIVTIAFPFAGTPANRSGHRIIRQPEVKAVSRHYRGAPDGLAKAWENLVFNSIAQGLTPSGKSRMVFLSDTAGSGEIDAELQLLLE